MGRSTTMRDTFVKVPLHRGHMKRSPRTGSSEWGSCAGDKESVGGGDYGGGRGRVRADRSSSGGAGACTVQLCAAEPARAPIWARLSELHRHEVLHPELLQRLPVRNPEAGKEPDEKPITRLNEEPNGCQSIERTGERAQGGRRARARARLRALRVCVRFCLFVDRLWRL